MRVSRTSYGALTCADCGAAAVQTWPGDVFISASQLDGQKTACNVALLSRRPIARPGTADALLMFILCYQTSPTRGVASFCEAPIVIAATRD
jgi:hypothetical protein